MSSAKRIAEFPDVEAKLQKPTKKSAFERQKAEAEAKRQREAAETAAVYEDFVKSFDNDGDDDTSSRPGDRPTPQRYDRPTGLGGQPPLGGGAGRRHFVLPSTPSGAGIKSGPGSLGPIPSSYGKKRPHDGFIDRRERADGRGRLGFDDDQSTSISKAFDASDDEAETMVAGRAQEKAVAKPTLRLSNLPPGTSPAAIKSLIPPALAVENVKILSSGPSNQNERKSTAAIVTLSMETGASEIDAAVSAMQNRYLGFGYYLSLHRHLSSAAISSSLANLNTSTTVAHPFGAKPVPQEGGRSQRSQMGQGRGFAPPPQYGPPGSAINRSGILHVPVQAPKDIKQLRTVHKVIEGVMEYGPEFEALLMSRTDVQRDEKWAWIWDARSEGGIWYRYRLWEIVCGSTTVRGHGKFIPMFEGSHAWKMPDHLPYEYNTRVDEFVSDSEYNSSDDDDFDDEQTRPGEGPGNDQEEMFMSPLEKSKLTHLLARLPDSLTKLRKGDIARITTFAIRHANRGSDEIVDMVVLNIERPFCYSHANPAYNPKDNEQEKGGLDRDITHSEPQAEKVSHDIQDTSTARLVGLYTLSDILSSSSTSGVRHAWRYRQLFEAVLKSRRIFEELGLMAEKLSWGRMRADKWKRSVGLVLSLWEGWCVFSAETQAMLVDTFENPPSAKKDKAEDDGSKKGRWKAMGNAAAKSVEESSFRPVLPTAATEGPGPTRPEQGAEADIEGDYEILYYTDDEDLDLAALDEEGIDGKPLLVDIYAGRPVDEAGMQEVVAKIQGRAAAA